MVKSFTSDLFAFKEITTTILKKNGVKRSEDYNKLKTSILASLKKFEDHLKEDSERLSVGEHTDDCNIRKNYGNLKSTREKKITPEKSLK